eukprot:Ihof_evm1s889 gene=Ihof_evmTU1s889
MARKNKKEAGKPSQKVEPTETFENVNEENNELVEEKEKETDLLINLSEVTLAEKEAKEEESTLIPQEEKEEIVIGDKIKDVVVEGDEKEIEVAEEIKKEEKGTSDARQEEEENTNDIKQEETIAIMSTESLDRDEENVDSKPMMSSATEKPKTPLVGPLPDDFLQPVKHRLSNSPKYAYSLLVTIDRAILLRNVGRLPMSLYAVVMVGKGMTSTHMHNYCGTSPIWNTTVQFDLHSRSPRKLSVEIHMWGLINDTKLAWCDIPLESIYQPNGHIAGRFELVDKDGKAGEVMIEITLQKTLINGPDVNAVLTQSSSRRTSSSYPLTNPLPSQSPMNAK